MFVSHVLTVTWKRQQLDGEEMFAWAGLLVVIRYQSGTDPDDLCPWRHCAPIRRDEWDEFEWSFWWTGILQTDVAVEDECDINANFSSLHIVRLMREVIQRSAIGTDSCRLQHPCLRLLTVATHYRLTLRAVHAWVGTLSFIHTQTWSMT